MQALTDAGGGGGRGVEVGGEEVGAAPSTVASGVFTNCATEKPQNRLFN